MERRKFGNTDLMVSMIGLGCYGMSGAYGPADDAESIATIRCALDLGVNLSVQQLPQRVDPTNDQWPKTHACVNRVSVQRSP